MGADTGEVPARTKAKFATEEQGIPELLIYLRFCSVSHFNEINVKIYLDQFSKTTAPFRYVKKRSPITNRLPAVTGGDRNW
jgi:hypothetical protein